jgi:hypothetical protein
VATICRTTILYRSSARRKYGRYFTTGASRSILPFSTSCMMDVATKGLVMEAMWKSERVVMGSSLRVTFLTPKLAA